MDDGNNAISLIPLNFRPQPWNIPLRGSYAFIMSGLPQGPVKRELMQIGAFNFHAPLRPKGLRRKHWANYDQLSKLLIGQICVDLCKLRFSFRQVTFLFVSKLLSTL